VEKVCIDIGNADVKVKTATQLVKFKSSIQPAFSDDGDVIKLRGNRFQVGAGYPDISLDKSNSLSFELYFLKALADCTEDEYGEFHVFLDLPLLHFYNVSYRDELSKKLLGEHNFEYNGKKKKICVVRIDYYPQGLIALFANDITNYCDRIVGIVDIGGLTVDAIVVDNLSPIKDSMFSINQGTIILENNVKTRLNQEFLLNLQGYEIPYIIREGKSNRIPNSDRVINQVIEEYFTTLKLEMDKRNWSTETIDIIGIGGGALLLKDYLELNFNYTQTPNPPYDNVLGLWELSRRIDS
jgi:plasmid segregation protein ParM